MTERLMGEVSLNQEFQAMSVSKRLVRSVSQKLKKRNKSEVEEEEDGTKGVSVSCLPLYGFGGGCRVNAETSESFGDCSARRRSSASEEAKGYKAICGVEDTGIDCFSYGMTEKFFKRNNRKSLELGDSLGNSRMHPFLPDEILEMCLVRLPLTSLMNARLVCRRWRSLTTTPRFMQIRNEGLHQSPWLFLFGAVKDGYCSGEIHAFDLSLNQWHKLHSEFLKGRFLFSVASLGDQIYIVGGCSSLTNSGKMDRSSFKTHKGVIVFSPLTKSWSKIASMKYARSAPVLGISDVSSDCVLIRSSQQSRHDRRFYRSRVGGISDIYEDPHRLSLRRQSSDGYESLSVHSRKLSKFTRQRIDHSSTKVCRRFVMIAVGGHGSWDEPLDSGEIYDSASNKWAEIQRLPVDFGNVCSGVVCNGMFYVYSENDRLAAYDIERGFWIGIQTTPLPSRVHEYYPKLISCNGSLFMLCVSWCEGDGQIGRRNKAIRKVWELDLSYLVWTEVSVHPDAPMDWNASFVADRNLIFGVEMFKIFGQVLDFMTVCDVSRKGSNWSHISRNHLARELDPSSCMAKTMAVLHL